MALITAAAASLAYWGGAVPGFPPGGRAADGQQQPDDATTVGQAPGRPAVVVLPQAGNRGGGGAAAAAAVWRPPVRGGGGGRRTVVPYGPWEAFATQSLWLRVNASAHVGMPDERARSTAGCAHLQAAFASNASAVLDADASFRHLSCLQCVPAYVPLECPPGDAFVGGPLPPDMSMILNDEWPVRPNATSAGRAVLHYLARLNCSTWRRGAFLPCSYLRHVATHPVHSIADATPQVRFQEPALPPLPAGHPAAGSGLPACDPSDFAALSDGAWDPSTGLWTPRGCRLPYRIPWPDVHACLRGVRLMFLGDSPLRQLSNRLVAHLRGVLHTVEHEFGAVALYRWDGRFDEWAIQPHVTRRSHGLLEDDPPPNVTGLRVGLDLPLQGPPGSPAARHFLMLRAFDSKLERADGHSALMRAFKPTDLVVGSNYWIKRGATSQRAPARIAAQVRRYVLERRRAGHPLRSVVWYAFPCHAPGLLPGDSDRGYHEARDAGVRAALEALWAAEGGPGGALGNTTLAYLPTCAPARAAGMNAWATDTVHTACRFDPMPDRAGMGKPLRAIKPTFTLDCSDPISVTNIRVLLTHLCPRLAERAAGSDEGLERAPSGSPAPAPGSSTDQEAAPSNATGKDAPSL